MAALLVLPLLTAEPERLVQHIDDANLEQVAERLSALRDRSVVIVDGDALPMSLYGPASLDPALEALALLNLLDWSGYTVVRTGEAFRVVPHTGQPRVPAMYRPEPSGLVALVVPKEMSSAPLEQLDNPFVSAIEEPSAWIVTGHAQHVAAVRVWLEEAE